MTTHCVSRESQPYWDIHTYWTKLGITGGSFSVVLRPAVKEANGFLKVSPRKKY